MNNAKYSGSGYLSFLGDFSQGVFFARFGRENLKPTSLWGLDNLLSSGLGRMIFANEGYD